MRIVFIVFFLFLTSCGGGDSNKKEKERVVYTYTMQEPEKSINKSFSGIITPPKKVVLSFQVSGRVIALHKGLGDFVMDGELLAKLDSTNYELEQQRAQANLVKAATQYQQASHDYERNRALYETENISQATLDSSWANFQQAQSEWKAMQHTLSLAQKKLESTELYSPVDGVVLSVDMELYQTIDRGDPVFHIASGEGFDAVIGVPASLIQRIEVGSLAKVTFSDLEELELKAVVVKKAVSPGEEGRYAVFFHVLEQNSLLRSGMLCRVTLDLPLSEKEQVMILPNEALMRGPKGVTQVWIYDDGMEEVKSREVKLKELTSRGIVVESGVAPGEKVVVRGVHQLKEGQKVEGRDFSELESGR